MKKLFILFAFLLSIASFGQNTPSSPITGATEFRNVAASHRLGLPGDTLTPTGAYWKNTALLSVLNDSILMVWSVDLQKYVIAKTSAGAVSWGSITGLISSNSQLMDSLNARQRTITPGTSAQYIKGNFTLGTFVTDVQAIGDPRWAPISHSHVFANITDGTTAVRNLFSAGTGISYNPSTGVIAATGSVSVAWGDITGTLSNQTDLQAALNLKLNRADSVDLPHYATQYDLTQIPNTFSNGDTTIFETVIDSTLQPGQRVLFSGGSNRIRSDSYLLYDSINNKLMINHFNISAGGPNTKFYVNGNSNIIGTLTMSTGVIANAPTVSAGTYDVLTRNVSGGAIERVGSTTWVRVVDSSGMLASYIHSPGWGLLEGGQHLRVDTSLVATRVYVESLVEANNNIPTLQQVFDVQTGEALLTKNDTINLGGFFLDIKGSGSNLTRFNSTMNTMSFSDASFDNYFEVGTNGLTFLRTPSSFGRSVTINTKDSLRLYSQNTSGGTGIIALTSDSLRLAINGGAFNIPELRVTYDDTTGYKPMVWNKFNKSWRYFNSWGEIGLSGGSQTWQQTLTTGSTLTQTNTIAFDGFDLHFLNDNAGVNDDFRATVQDADEGAYIQAANGQAQMQAYDYPNFNNIGKAVVNDGSVQLFASSVNSSNQMLLYADSVQFDYSRAGNTARSTFVVRKLPFKSSLLATDSLLLANTWGQFYKIASADLGISGYTDEQAQDAVGTILNTNTFNYDDATPTITLKTQMSITSDASGIKLSGDVSSPGNSYYYGTNPSGTKGWFAFSTGYWGGQFHGVNTQSGSVSMDGSAVGYTFNGSTASTFTLPTISPNHIARAYFVKNAGTATLTIARSSTDNIYTTSDVTSFDVTAGNSVIIWNNGTRWLTHQINAELDGSATNELQTINNTSDATSHTVTLSNSGGTIQFIEGANVTLTTGGTGAAGTLTIAATGGTGSPAGADNEIQINNAGAFGVDTWKIDAGILRNATASGTANLQVNGNAHVTGTTSDGTTKTLELFAANGASRTAFWSDGHLTFNNGTASGAAVIEIVNETLATVIRNTSAASYSRHSLRNDQNLSSRALDIAYTGSTYGAFWTSGYSGEQGAIGTPGSYPITFATNNTQRMLIEGGGDIGIGLTNPTAKLHIKEVATTDIALILDGVASQTGDFLQIKNSGGTDLIEVNAAGELITADLPDAGDYNIQSGNKLYVKGTSNGAIARFETTTEIFDINSVSGGTRLYANGFLNIYTVGNGLSFSTNSNSVGEVTTAGWSFSNTAPANHGRWLTAEQLNTTADAVTHIARFSHKLASGTHTVGIGTGMEFETETGASNFEVGTTFESITTDITSTSEDFDLVVKLMAAGAAAAEKLRVLSTGELKVQTLNNDNAETNLVVWNATDKIFEYRTVASLPGGGSSALSSITAGVASNTINSGNNDQTWQWNSLGGKTGFMMEANTTAAAAGQILAQFKLHGANTTSGISTTAVFIENNHSGTTSTNTALLVSAINGTTANYAIWSDAGINKFLGAVELGQAGTLGVLKLFGNTSGVVTINTLAAAGTYTLTLPANDGDADQYLKTDGNGGLSWATVAAGSGHTIRNEGTDLTARLGLNFIGSAVTAADDAAGNETEITFDAEVNGIADLATSGIVTRTGAGTFAGRTLTGTTNRIVITDGDGVAGNPTFDIGTDVVTLTATQTLSGKTLTAPRFANGGFIADNNGNELIIFTTTTSAVNEVTFANAATGANPQWTASGGDADVGINWLVKGAGKFNFLASASGPAEIRLFEDSDNGTNYIGIIGQATLGANRTITLPDATGTVVLNDNTATLTNKSIDASQLTGSVATARLTNVKQIKTIALAAPTTNDDWGFFTTQAITITGVTGVMLGTSQSVTLTLNYGDSRATADGTVVASNTFDSGDTGYQTTGFAFTLNTTSIPAGTFVWFDITGVSGTINTLELNIEYSLQ